MRAAVIVLLSIILSGCKHVRLIRPQEQYDNSKYQFGPQIYILMGQSNMTGLAAGPFPDLDPRVTVLKSDAAQTDQQTGPGFVFGIDMARRNRNIQVILVQCAYGGSRIESSMPGGYLYTSCVQKVDELLKQTPGSVIGSILFWQGETEGFFGPAANWNTRAQSVIDGLRAYYHDTIPVVLCQIGVTTQPQVAWIDIRAQQAALRWPRLALVKTDDQPLLGDGVHYSQSAYLVIGQRMSDAYWGLINE